jgi:hypothetical protein
VAFAFGGRHSIQLSYGCFLLTQCLRGNFCGVKALCPTRINYGNYCKKIPYLSRFEPLASAFGGQRSIQLSYGCIVERGA